MFVKNPLLSLAAALLILVNLAGCSPSQSATTPNAPNAPTVENATPSGPTETSIPTSTIAPTNNSIPTNVPATPTLSATNATKPATAGTAITPKAGTGTAVLLATSAGQGSSSTVDKYAYISQSYPDNYQIRPGRSITITWAVKNVGTVGWTTDYTYRHFGGVGAAKEVYNFPATVPANATAQISVTFTTPSAPGNYSTWWKLTNSQGQNFGDVDFSFVVTNSPVALTKVPAATAVK